MTITRTPMSGLPGIDRFSPAQLLRTARLFASDPQLPNLVDPEAGERRWVELLEQTAHGNRREHRTLIAGEGRPFGPNHVHHVANVGVQPALSVHLYAPRLTTMTRYAQTPAGLQPNGVDAVGVIW